MLCASADRLSGKSETRLNVINGSEAQKRKRGTMRMKTDLYEKIQYKPRSRLKGDSFLFALSLVFICIQSPDSPRLSWVTIFLNSEFENRLLFFISC